MSNADRGLVATIVDDREIVLNIGRRDGVLEGMRYAVIGQTGKPVLDPVTKEILQDSLEITKTIVKIVRVSDRVSTGRTFRTYRSGGSPFQMFQPEREYTEKISTLEQTEREKLGDGANTVQIGDQVIHVTGNEYGE